MKWAIITFAVFVCTFFFQLAVSSPRSQSVCKGWDCPEVTCPNGYAVLVPGKGYLPCEKFDDYINGNKKVLIK